MENTEDLELALHTQVKQLREIFKLLRKAEAEKDTDMVDIICPAVLALAEKMLESCKRYEAVAQDAELEWTKKHKIGALLAITLLTKLESYHG